jgi:hypothetical protein
MSEAVLEELDAVEELDDDGGAFEVDAEVALEAHELGDAEGDFAFEGGLLFVGVGVDDAEVDQVLDEVDFDAAADGDFMY